MAPPARSSRPPRGRRGDAQSSRRSVEKGDSSHLSRSRQVPKAFVHLPRTCHGGRRRPRGIWENREERESFRDSAEWRRTGRAMTSSRTIATTASWSSPRRGWRCEPLGGRAAARADAPDRRGGGRGGQRLRHGLRQAPHRRVSGRRRPRRAGPAGARSAAARGSRRPGAPLPGQAAVRMETARLGSHGAAKDAHVKAPLRALGNASASARREEQELAVARAAREARADQCAQLREPLRRLEEELAARIAAVAAHEERVAERRDGGGARVRRRAHRPADRVPRRRGHARLLGAAAAGAPQLRDPHRVAAGHCAGRGRAASKRAFVRRASASSACRSRGWWWRGPSPTAPCASRAPSSSATAPSAASPSSPPSCSRPPPGAPLSSRIRFVPRRGGPQGTGCLTGGNRGQPASHWHAGLASTAKRTQRVLSMLAQRKMTPKTANPILIVHTKK
jgi:hypothetical protein